MKPVLKVLFFLCLLQFSCSENKKEKIVYQKFIDQKWHRFDKLKFNISIDKDNTTADLFFFVRHSKKIQFEKIDFGMVLNTPSGEERINQYTIQIREKSGDFQSKCGAQDTCYAEIPLKKELFISKKGVLTIEIESLVPRLEIAELFGVGIRVDYGN